MQKEAQIEQMVRDGQSLGAVAAALASPETAERIALMEAATSGALAPLDAARLSLRRAGQDSAMLDGLLAGFRCAIYRGGGRRTARPFGAWPAGHPMTRRLEVASLVHQPAATGATWTAADYAARDAQLARLGIAYAPRRASVKADQASQHSARH